MFVNRCLSVPMPNSFRSTWVSDNTSSHFLSQVSATAALLPIFVFLQAFLVLGKSAFIDW